MAQKQLDALGQDIFESRYAYPGEKTWSDRARVIARTVASAEKDADKSKVEKAFFNAISTGDFIPGGRIIYGAGRASGRHNLLNCFCVNPDDTVQSIGKTLDDVYRISCAGGGVGLNFSNIRPKGEDIGNDPNSHPGSVSIIKLVNQIGDQVKAGKNRRTALMGILNVTHPDLLDFLDSKLNKNELNNFNISIAVTNRFLEAVELDEEWYFTFNNKNYYTYELTREGEGHDPEVIFVTAIDADCALAIAENLKSSSTMVSADVKIKGHCMFFSHLSKLKPGPEPRPK